MLSASPISPATIAASVELYRQMALRWNRTREKQNSETFDPVNLFDTRPFTEEEAQAETAEMTSRFAELLQRRNHPETGLVIDGDGDPYMLLGFDLILDMPQA